MEFIISRTSCEEPPHEDAILKEISYREEFQFSKTDIKKKKVWIIKIGTLKKLIEFIDNITHKNKRLIPGLKDVILSYNGKYKKYTLEIYDDYRE